MGAKWTKCGLVMVNFTQQFDCARVSKYLIDLALLIEGVCTFFASEI